MEPTEEQQAARDVFVNGNDLALVAGAGTGKTSTLTLMGASTRKRGLYVAFNRSIADEAARKFGRNVECRTAHSLAFRAVGGAYRERLNVSARIPARETARLLGITRILPIGAQRITVNHQARLVMGMIRKFCYSTDRQVVARHAEWVNGLDSSGQDYLARHLLPYAHQAWDDICSPTGKLRFEHDHYMKVWALGRPVLAADFVLLDEAQDTNPVLEEVFLAQDAQRVCVGDPAQQIYGWRSARDVMTGFPAEQLHLTRSFRFGPKIAHVANRWLHHAESEMQLTGCSPDRGRVEKLYHSDAVLCRGNGDAMQEVFAFLEAGVPVALAGGGNALLGIAKAARDLQSGRRTSHRELFLFSDWGEVQDYVEHDTAGQDLRATVQLIDAHGPDKIEQAVNRLSHEDQARVVVSTAHKAKGREWASVRISGGFSAPSVNDNGVQNSLSTAEARLIYVAVSRARQALDPEGVAWIDEYERALAQSQRVPTPREMINLSLTGQLRYDSSPVSRFMAEHLPLSQNVVRDYLSRITSLPHPVQPVDVRYPNWSALGHAIDYRLRLSFGSSLGSAVTHGVFALGTDIPLRGEPDGARSALHEAGRELLKTIAANLATPGFLPEDDIVRLCFVAGFFEDIMRTGEIRRYSMLADATADTRLTDLTAAVPAYVLDDIKRQLHLSAEPLAPFRALPAPTKTCGPVFAGSADIGGADADFVLDGLLLDCKAAKNPRTLGRDEIHQLAGYLLLDYDDVLGINQVGLYLSRQGGLITWRTDDFLKLLGSPLALPDLRAALRTHLRGAATGP
ncbi:UvrD-helicase domain-containing protein [Streptomyces sp. NPDC021093]|uniref:UvrD-helicase domain-containing protein n=1 Tax=Streptomyces sp. NPDC021093 TaxID=3365112 RepID=UPI0037923B41